MKREIDVRLVGLGICPIGDSFGPLSKEEVAIIEAAFGAQPPEDYRDFAQRYGAATFEQSIHFRLKNPTPLFAGVSARRYEMAPLSHFYGANTGPQGLVKKLGVFKGRMPDTLMPIAADGGGHQICLGVAGAERDRVYYWDHDREFDEDDYEEEDGTKPGVGPSTVSGFWRRVVTLLVGTYSWRDDGTADVVVMPQPYCFGGGEATRRSIWGSDAVRASGGLMLSRLADQDLWVEHHDLAAFRAECETLMSVAPRLAQQLQTDTDLIETKLGYFLKAIDIARATSSGVVIY